MPHVKSLQEGLQEAFAWYKEHGFEVNRKDYMTYIDKNLRRKKMMNITVSDNGNGFTEGEVIGSLALDPRDNELQWSAPLPLVQKKETSIRVFCRKGNPRLVRLECRP